jgi:DNA-binding NarL/FixJ family response regulator
MSRPTLTADLWSYLPPAQARRARRDAMVLQLLGQGWSQRQVADVLCLSPALICRIARRGCKRLQIRETPVQEGPELPEWLARLSATEHRGEET